MVYLEDALLVGVLISALWVFSTDYNSHFTLPKLSAIGLVAGALLLPLLLRLYYGEVNRLPTRVWLPPLLLLLWWLLGTSQSIHLQTALFGQPGRFNGLYTHLLWLTLFMLLVSLPFDLKRSHRFINLFYLVVIPVAVYGLWQYFIGSAVFDLGDARRPISSIGNPVSLAAIIGVALPFVLQELIVRQDWRGRAIFLVFFLALVLVLLLTTSRGGWLGAGAALMVFLYANRQLRIRFSKRLYRALFLVLVIAGLSVWLVDFAQISKLVFSYSSLGARLIYFTAALAIIKDNPIFGSGFESFRLVYPGYRSTGDIESMTLYDITPTMVHNDYLQVAVDNGLPALLLFIVLLISAIGLMLSTMKQQPEKRNLLIPLVAAITGFLVQAMSGWYEVSTSALFWVLLGFGVSVCLTNESGQAINNIRLTRLFMLPTLMAVIFLFYFTDCNINTLVLDNALRQMQVQHRSGRILEVDRISGLMDKNYQNNFYYRDQIGLIYMNRLAKYKRIEDYQKAHSYFSKAVEDNPFSPYVATHLILLDTLALKIKLIRQPSAGARAEVEKLAGKDPNNPTVYEVLAKYFTELRDQEGIRKNLEMMEKVAGGRENLLKRAEAQRKRAERRR